MFLRSASRIVRPEILHVSSRTYASRRSKVMKALSPEEVKEFARDALGKLRGTKPLDALYAFDVSHLRYTHPRVYDVLYAHFSDDLLAACQAAYPDHEWRPWLFKNRVASKGYWADITRRKAFFDWYAREMLQKDPEDPETWYDVNRLDIEACGGGFMMERYYKETVRLAVTQLYTPKTPWVMWRFPKLPAGWWDVKANQRAYCDYYAQQRNFSSWKDWYRVTSDDWIKDRLSTVVTRNYESSLSKMVKSVYPEHPWVDWEFRYLPRGFWNSPLNRKRFMDAAGEKLGVSLPDDWYSITPKMLLNVAPSGASYLGPLNSHSLRKALQRAYPEHEWVAAHFIQSPKGSGYKNNNKDTDEDDE